MPAMKRDTGESDPMPKSGGATHRSLSGLRAAFQGRELPSGPDAAPPAESEPKAPGRVIVRRERSGRGGKTVTLAEGPGLQGRKLEPLAREIAHALGAGARVEQNAIVVQGDQSDRLIAWLTKNGFGSITRGN